MRKLILATAAMIVLPFAAACAQPAPQTYTLTVTANDIAIIGGALGSRPYNEVAPLLAKLDTQIKQQNEAAAKPPEPAAEKKE